jgi:cytochrome P450
MASASPKFADNPHWLPKLPAGSLDHIPGEKGWPILGNTLPLLRDPLNFAKNMVAKYGMVYRNNAFGGEQITMVGAEANELMLFDRDKVFSNEQGWGPMINYLFPRGLMLMDFDHHRMDRRTLSVAFKPEPMRNYADALNTGINARVQQWSGTEFKFYPAIKQLTLDLAATSFLGIPWGPEADKINQSFVDSVRASVANMLSIFSQNWCPSAASMMARTFLPKFAKPAMKMAI